MLTLAPLTRVRAIVKDNGLMTQEASEYFQRLELIQPILGDGDPEGAVDGQAGQTYYDLSGSTGQIIYVKQSDEVGGDSKKGWTLA